MNGGVGTRTFRAPSGGARVGVTLGAWGSHGVRCGTRR